MGQRPQLALDGPTMLLTAPGPARLHAEAACGGVGADAWFTGTTTACVGGCAASARVADECRAYAEADYNVVGLWDGRVRRQPWEPWR